MYFESLSKLQCNTWRIYNGDCKLYIMTLSFFLQFGYDIQPYETTGYNVYCCRFILDSDMRRNFSEGDEFSKKIENFLPFF